MKYILILISIIFASCGGSRKPKVYEPIIISKIVPNTDASTKEHIYCKYFGTGGGLPRKPKFIDTCGKFKVGDTIYVNFYKK